MARKKVRKLSKKEAKEIKEHQEETNDSNLQTAENQKKKNKSDDSERSIVNSSVPEWAQVHKDTWREPSVTKMPDNVKVHDYKEKKEEKNTQKNLFENAKPPKDKKPEDPNWWGGNNK